MKKYSMFYVALQNVNRVYVHKCMYTCVNFYEQKFKHLHKVENEEHKSLVR